MSLDGLPALRRVRREVGFGCNPDVDLFPVEADRSADANKGNLVVLDPIVYGTRFDAEELGDVFDGEHGISWCEGARLGVEWE